MTEPGGPRRGRHSSEGSYGPGFDLPGTPSGDPFPGYGVPRYEPSRYEPPTWSAEPPPPARDTTGAPTADLPTAGFRRASGVLDRLPADETGPLVEPEWWAYGSSDDTGYPLSARHARRDDEPLEHPSGPLPPRPPGVWDRLHPRDDGPGDDAETVAQPLLPGAPLDSRRWNEETAGPVGAHRASDDDGTEAHPQDAGAAGAPGWEDQTGGLDVIGAHVEDDAPRRRRRGRRGRRPEPEQHDDLHDEHGDLLHDEDSLVHDEAFGEDIPVKPYDKRTGRARRRRNPVAVLISLLVLGGLVVGIVIGGQKLLELINPTAQDYTGQGTGTIQIRVQNGDTLSDIARTLVEADVIASIRPFVNAAEENAASVGIQPGVYELRQQMSGQAALDLLLDPVSRLLSRVTLPEGLTVERTLARIAEATGRPIEELEAAAADPAALGVPAWANGSLEGLLFPATYDVEPDTAPAALLRQMVARGLRALDDLQIAEADRLTVLTKASLVQAEAASPEDMAKVARVLENRLSDGMPLQLDTTVNYANGKSGITTTPEDRANPSPYNTYVHAGLPPGPITNPGEEALRAVLAPTPGDWRFFVVVDPDTGETRFAATGAEHQQNVLLFQQWLRENPGG
ncbi:endolytic transglycosylase MltG [Blastococcus sp. PRF04-17]|uniref:endolytic transglycosylase MltG n=1 Tax=Blastococcus sp. PRF04-17 TaxID=2933797 RepID=UPI001FF46DFC|nr:endolytic transglycosylase MltG [Blastococcus sp. PRF04-17]UOY02782.1 endolytic transglycosylase MltG [Blastococcus sp. PRF04-17]